MLTEITKNLWIDLSKIIYIDYYAPTLDILINCQQDKCLSLQDKNGKTYNSLIEKLKEFYGLKND